MSQPYRANEPSGIKIEATGEIIFPGHPLWPEYEAWLAEQPGAATPGGPLPPGTGLLPYIPPVQTLAQQRAEALARLSGVLSERRGFGTVTAIGHTWTAHWAFVLLVTTHRAAMPPFPAGFTLPDIAGAQVPIANADLNALVAAYSARYVALNAVSAAFVTAINASATPLAIDLNAGWPP